MIMIKNILVYLSMIGLLIIIILPPMLRSYFPKSVESVKNESKLEILRCSKTVDIYQITVSNTYKDSVIDKVSIVYNYSSTVEDKTSLTMQEINSFKVIPEVNFTTSNNMYTVLITRAAYLKNTSNNDLKSRFQPKNQQTEYYTNLGYKCSTIFS